MKMDSTTKSVAELESIVQLLKDELREKDLLGRKSLHRDQIQPQYDTMSNE